MPDFIERHSSQLLVLHFGFSERASGFTRMPPRPTSTIVAP